MILAVGLVSKKARYKILARVHIQPLMEAMNHNLYGSPGIIISCL
ncbi:MAG: hypothetical protein ACMUEL_00840 [Flavobacteriales bacterium Tduv]